MKSFLLFLCFVTLCQGHTILSNPLLRGKRQASGALHIVTKNGEAIHEEVQPDLGLQPKQPQDLKIVGHPSSDTPRPELLSSEEHNSESSNTSPVPVRLTTVAKPCPERKSPSFIEMGTVFQVTAPQDSLFKGKSLRKSAPLSNKLELIRSINRVVTLFVLLISAGIEFYPMIRHVYHLVNFM